MYWNSRLETEHDRLIDTYLRPGDVFVDMMCGIGPFAVRAARKGNVVLANDLNPDSVKWLRVNAAKNPGGERVRAFNMCAREFMRSIHGAGGEAGTVDLGAAGGNPRKKKEIGTPGRMGEEVASGGGGEGLIGSRGVMDCVLFSLDLVSEDSMSLQNCQTRLPSSRRTVFGTTTWR